MLHRLRPRAGAGPSLFAPLFGAPTAAASVRHLQAAAAAWGLSVSLPSTTTGYVFGRGNTNYVGALLSGNRPPSITLSVTNLPAGGTYEGTACYDSGALAEPAGPVSVAPGAAGPSNPLVIVLAITLPTTTPVGKYALSAVASDGAQTQRAAVPVTVQPHCGHKLARKRDRGPGSRLDTRAAKLGRESGQGVSPCRAIQPHGCCVARSAGACRGRRSA